jgi:hypothetical protein
VLRELEKNEGRERKGKGVRKRKREVKGEGDFL